jgi:heat shock protein HslJ
MNGQELPELPDASGLVNLWRVSGAAGEAGNTWLRLDATEFQLWRDCGVITGDWRAHADLFLAWVVGATGHCFPLETIPAVPWLESATGFRAAHHGWILTDTHGTAVATLTIAGAPAADTDAARSFREPPTQSSDAGTWERVSGRRPPARPAGTSPATAAHLAGRWVPADLVAPTHPYLQVEADGSWHGSDGCNGNQGRWALNDRGDFLASSGMSTMMFCEGAPVPSWLAQARLAVFENGRLRLLDADGGRLGDLERG